METWGCFIHSLSGVIAERKKEQGGTERVTSEPLSGVWTCHHGEAAPRTDAREGRDGEPRMAGTGWP